MWEIPLFGQNSEWSSQLLVDTQPWSLIYQQSAETDYRLVFRLDVRWSDGLLMIRAIYKKLFCLLPHPQSGAAQEKGSTFNFERCICRLSRSCLSVIVKSDIYLILFFFKLKSSHLFALIASTDAFTVSWTEGWRLLASLFSFFIFNSSQVKSASCLP